MKHKTTIPTGKSFKELTGKHEAEWLYDHTTELLKTIVWQEILIMSVHELDKHILIDITLR